MRNRFLITVGTLFFGCVCSIKAGIREDLEAANRIPDEQWVEKAKLYISAFDELYVGLVNKWKEVGGNFKGNPFFLYAWKKGEFITLRGNGHIYFMPYFWDKTQHNPRNCGPHCLRGACCYPCVECCDDVGIKEEECFLAWTSGTPLFCCLSLCNVCADLGTVEYDYFNLNIYKPICKKWLYPLLGLEKGNCKKLYTYWMRNFCEPVANLLQKVSKYNFTQFSAEQLDTVLNLYRIYYNSDNHFAGDKLCPLPFFETLPNLFNNKIANLIINSLNISNENTLQYLAIVLALDTGMIDESLKYPVYDLTRYSIDIVSVFKTLMAQNAIKTIQVHSIIKDACEVFLVRAQQKLDEKNAYNQGAAVRNGFNYTARRINE